jgi:hypothetical protein
MSYTPESVHQKASSFWVPLQVLAAVNNSPQAICKRAAGIVSDDGIGQCRTDTIPDTSAHVCSGTKTVSPFVLARESYARVVILCYHQVKTNSRTN